MNELAAAICRLFEPDPSPVIAVSGGIILFYNPAALRLLPTISQGKRANNFLPEFMLHCNEEYYVSTARIGQQTVSACGTWYSGMLLLRLDLSQPRFDLSPDALATTVRVELSNQRMALDQLAQHLDQAQSQGANACFAVLNRSYYKLLRTCENMALADNIAQGKTVYDPTPTDLPCMVREVAALSAKVASKSGVDIRCSCDMEINPIMADPNLLRSMLLNLLSNSLRNSKPEDVIDIRLNARGSWLLLTVDDVGPGFPPELLGSVFQRAVVPSLPGQIGKTALGLFIVWGVADMHGGNVTISNRRRGGASVRIRIPRNGEALGQFHAPSTNYAAGQASPHLILSALADALPLSSFSQDDLR